MQSLNERINTLFHSQLLPISLPENGLVLELLDPATALDEFSPQQVEALWANMPYWAFAWSSGRALANYILAHPHLVKDKVVADFGAGSGLVALAALKAGAKKAVAVDIDPMALSACELNAQHNGLWLDTACSLQTMGQVDMLVVGDVLYDPRNHQLAQQLFQQARPMIWAESQGQTQLVQYGPVTSLQAETLPNLGGFDEHKDIYIYHHLIT